VEQRVGGQEITWERNATGAPDFAMNNRQ
jgi:hypothetical protein